MDYITFVNDRPGHDFKYAINTSKMKKKFNWEAKIKFSSGLYDTINWYKENRLKGNK